MSTRLIATLTLTLLIAIAAHAQHVTTDCDLAAPFASYKTYGWTTGTPSPNSLAEQRIHAAVETHLAGEGMALSNSRQDVIVATHVLRHDQKEVIANGFGPSGVGGWFATASVETYAQGTLIVDLYDARTKKLVWRGVATDTGIDKPSKDLSKVDKALDKIFWRYPPVGQDGEK